MKQAPLPHPATGYPENALYWYPTSPADRIKYRWVKESTAILNAPGLPAPAKELMMRNHMALFLIIAVLALAACGGNGGPAPPPDDFERMTATVQGTAGGPQRQD